MSYSLNSLKGVIQRILYGSIIGVIQGDIRSLDNGSRVASEPVKGPERADGSVQG